MGAGPVTTVGSRPGEPGSLVGTASPTPGASLTSSILLVAVAGLLMVAAGRALGRRAFLVAAAVTAAVVAWAATAWSRVVDGRPVVETTSWVAGLDLTFGLRVDGFSLLMVLVVAGIGTLIQLHAARYFAADRAGLHRLAGLLLVFTAAMLGVVTGANLMVVYVAWELTSITSYLLIGWNDEDPAARASALRALLVTGAGGLVMLGGFVLIGTAAETYDLAALAARPPEGTAVEVGLVLVLLGAFTKSAQFPFSSWLPAAMVAPTPVSAFLHSATMVKAGVYLIARLAPVFAAQGIWRPLVLTVGLVTMLAGGWRALREHDLKRILAFGTVSQLGFMVVLFGAGEPRATAAGVVVLLGHALFKAALFMVVGVIDHQAGTRDIRRLGRFGPGWGGPKLVAVVSGASMAGIPLLFGFVAKEAAYGAFVDGGRSGDGVVLAGLVLGSALTFAYTARILLGAFGPPTADDPVEPPPAPPWTLWAPAGVLAAITVVLGLAPGLVDGLVATAAHDLDPSGTPVHLSLWHGFNSALALSALTVLLGSVLVVGRGMVGVVQARAPRPLDGDAVYGAALRGLNTAARRVTSVAQPGSLPTYIGVILATAVVVPGWWLIRSPWPSGPAVESGWGDWAAGALLVAGALGAALARERLAAIVCLGIVGYGMGLVFVLQGAPDLALTQVTIDTLSVVVFILVLRRLPRRFEERPTPSGRALRLVVSAAVGLFVFAFIVVASGARVDPPVSSEFLARALPEGGGRNVVNVVLVDIRGADTVGEITVLAVAGMGAYGLARLSRRDTDSDRSGPR